MIKNRKETMGMESDNIRIQEFLDMIAPSVVKFNTDHFICGNTYRCVWALREYPTCNLQTMKPAKEGIQNEKP